MRSIQIGAFDARQAVVPDSSGELPGEIPCKRLRRSGTLAADLLADESVVAGETFGKRDRDLVGGKEGAAKVMAGLAGRNVLRKFVRAAIGRRDGGTTRSVCGGGGRPSRGLSAVRSFRRVQSWKRHGAGMLKLVPCFDEERD